MKYVFLIESRTRDRECILHMQLKLPMYKYHAGYTVLAHEVKRLTIYLLRRHRILIVSQEGLGHLRKLIVYKSDQLCLNN